MDSIVLKDYQFVLIIIAVLFICILLILVFFYGIKRKYDSIDRHISKKTKETYKECSAEYETLSDELGIKTNYINCKNIFNIIKKIFKL